mgnify:CR=1 FL=1
MKTYLDESLETKLCELRTYEAESFEKWGSRKRIFKMLGVDFEIKFCRAETMLRDTLYKGKVKEKLKMVDMMLRAFVALNKKCEESGYIMIQPNTRCFNFDKKTALICDTDDEKPILEKIHKNEPEMMIFSIEELLRCIPEDFMKAKELLSKIDRSVNFKRIRHEAFKQEKTNKHQEFDDKSYKYQVEDNLHNYIKITLSDDDLDTIVAQANIGSNEGTDPGGAESKTYDVTNSGTTAYVFNDSGFSNENNPNLTLKRGETYTFSVNTPGHPFLINSVQGTGTNNTYDNGVTNNGAVSGTITFTVPSDAPDTLFYNCEFHGSMTGTITITN